MADPTVITITAAPGKGSDPAQVPNSPRGGHEEPGRQQFEAFQSVVKPHRFTLLERWADQAALDAHAN